MSIYGGFLTLFVQENNWSQCLLFKITHNITYTGGANKDNMYTFTGEFTCILYMYIHSSTQGLGF